MVYTLQLLQQQSGAKQCMQKPATGMQAAAEQGQQQQHAAWAMPSRAVSSPTP